jgi:monoamine oxidase
MPAGSVEAQAGGAAPRAFSRRDFLARVGAVGGAAAVHEAATALGMLPGVARAAPVSLAPVSRPAPRVLIIGAGIGGLVAAYELVRAGYDCTVLEASARAGGRNLTIRGGDVVDEIGGRQRCGFDADPHLYFNAGPARIPASHTALLGYCRTLGVALEVFVNENRNAWVHDDAAFGGRPVRYRELAADARGFMAELLAKGLDPQSLDGRFTPMDAERIRDLARAFGDLAPDFAYRGSARAGFAAGGMVEPAVLKPAHAFGDILGSNF